MSVPSWFPAASATVLMALIVRSGSPHHEDEAVSTRCDSRQHVMFVPAEHAHSRLAPGELEAIHHLRVSGKNPTLPNDIHPVAARLRRLIQFEHEPLEQIAAEFNSYSDMPIEIEGQALRKLEVSGVLSVDDTASFVAFLQSLDGVQVEKTAARIRVFRRS